MSTDIIKTAELTIQRRAYSPATAMALAKEGINPLLARILASRGIRSASELGSRTQKGPIHYSQLLGAKEAASFLAQHIAAGKEFVIIADYDCDGATACAVALRGMRGFGANINFVVPDRMIHGYGLTPSVVALARERFPNADVMITVDNGVASHVGVAAAIENGFEVLVTDHHLPAKNKALPPAAVIVNPNQESCGFGSKALAGCGVIWYVMWALQDEFKTRGMKPVDGFHVSQLLPLVAVGTVADVVPLDENNRILVEAGLVRIRKGACPPGITELATVGVINYTEPAELVTTDIAFGIGPRVNAAGRLETMDLGIECLSSDDPEKCAEMAAQLDQINTNRKDLEYKTVVGAVTQAQALIQEGTLTIAVHEPHWHAGVIGIVAGRIKEQRYRPTFVLTTDEKSGEIKGSGRSIPGFNLKDVLDQVDKARPGLMPKFGGHAMAAGVTLRPGGFEEFRDEFEAQAAKWMTEDQLNQRIEHDGSLSGPEISIATALNLKEPTWGQLFLEPSFCDIFRVVSAKITGARKDQLNMIVERDGIEFKATRFRYEGPLPEGTIRLVYKLSLGKDKKRNHTLKLLIDHVIH